MAKWTCPKCNIEYYYPDGPRILIVVEGWDFCPKCGTKRDEPKVKVTKDGKTFEI